jgi:hypothetical protein
MALLMQHARQPPPRLAELRPDLDPRWAAIVERALAKDPADRFPDATAMRAALDQLAGPAIPPQRNEAWVPPAPPPALGTLHASVPGTFPVPAPVTVPAAQAAPGTAPVKAEDGSVASRGFAAAAAAAMAFAAAFCRRPSIAFAVCAGTALTAVVPVLFSP